MTVLRQNSDVFRILTKVALVAGLAFLLHAGALQGQNRPRPIGGSTQTDTVATLIADTLNLVGVTGIEARGNVEIYYGSIQLFADRLTYDKSTGRLNITGPIRMLDGDRVLLLAAMAEISDDLRDGILRSARMVLDRQLQIAAHQITLEQGRYVRLNHAAATSCHTCANDSEPLWQIRAANIVHDREARQLYFHNARFLVRGVPVFYVPRLRLPDPTLDRATGFLMPEFRSNSRLGAGFKFPYFFRLGDHRDLTITPWLSSRTRTLELRYRQAFHSGNVTFNGAVSDDDNLSGRRWYLFAEGDFALPRDYRLAFDIKMTSDRAYLLDYGFSGEDRLESRLSISRARRNKFVSFELVHLHTLRAGENYSTQPALAADFLIHKRSRPAHIGGALDLQFEGHSHFRSANTPGNDGRDVVRLSGNMDWRRDFRLGNGMVFAAIAGADLDYYALHDAGAGEDDGFFLNGTLGAELRWPLIRRARTAGGATVLLEPVVQLFYSDDATRNIPNEDSVLLEFDEGNLFSDSRFTGSDAVERGLRGNVGLSWTRVAPAGWSMSVTAGRIFRPHDPGDFTLGSGLTGRSSDWLLSGQLRLNNGLTLSNRALFDDHFSFSRNETTVGWSGARVTLDSTYLWIESAAAENRPQTSEWSFDGSYDFNDRWTGTADWRYDFINDRAARIGLGMNYRNECVEVGFSIARRFTSSTSVRPTTDYGVTVTLSGFGVNSNSTALARRCHG